MERDPKKKPDPEEFGDLLELPDLTGDGLDEPDYEAVLPDDLVGPPPPPARVEPVEPIEPEPATIRAVPVSRPRKVYNGMWGRSEIAAAGLGIFAVLAVVAFVFIYLLPAKRDLEKSRADRDQLEQELTSSRKKYGNITDTETEVANLISSVDAFERRFLRIPDNGKIAVYQQLNNQIAQYGLVNTSGPDYAPLDILDAMTGRQQPERETGRDKLISLFPGLYVTLTVEGSYGNLRRFIRDIETSDQFIMISSIEFVPADAAGEKKDQNAGQAPGPNPTPENLRTGGDTGKMHGATVSLKLEMAAYFSRSARPPVVESGP